MQTDSSDNKCILCQECRYWEILEEDVVLGFEHGFAWGICTGTETSKRLLLQESQRTVIVCADKLGAGKKTENSPITHNTFGCPWGVLHGSVSKEKRYLREELEERRKELLVIKEGHQREWRTLFTVWWRHFSNTPIDSRQLIEMCVEEAHKFSFEDMFLLAVDFFLPALPAFEHDLIQLVARDVPSQVTLRSSSHDEYKRIVWWLQPI